MRAGARTELIASGAEMVAGYDPRSGKELWRARGTESHPIPSAVSGHGLIFFTAGSQAKRAMAIRPGGDGDLTESAIVWSYARARPTCRRRSCTGDYLYLMTDAGLVTCLDAQTGEVKYEGGRPPVPATFTASLVAYGDRLLMTSEDGDTFVLKAGPAHEILRTNSVGEPVYASPALAGAHDLHPRRASICSRFEPGESDGGHGQATEGISRYRIYKSTEATKFNGGITERARCLLAVRRITTELCLLRYSSFSPLLRFEDPVPL